MNIFFIKVLSEREGLLEAEEARHALTVLRHRPGDLLHCIDGQGNKYLARIAESGKREARLDLLERESEWGEKPLWLRLAISPLKAKDRLEWAIEKAVELGVNEICPVQCQRTVKTGVKAERMEAIMLSALKQCKRSRMPLFQPLQSFSEFVNSDLKGPLFIPWCEAEASLQAFGTTIRAARELTLLIGPEGDFTGEEIQASQHKGFQPVSLGENRLRTETAAVYALGAMKWEGGW